MIPRKSLAETFKEAYYKRYNKELERINIIFDIKKKIKETRLFSKCSKEEKETKEFYPHLSGAGANRISILNLGEFPPYEVTQTYIIPMGYSIKKKFFTYQGAKINREKMFYFFTVQSNGIKIEAEDKHLFKDWDEFIRLTTKSTENLVLAEFIGVTTHNVLSYIEQLGDISNFKKYIPICMRYKL